MGPTGTREEFDRSKVLAAVGTPEFDQASSWWSSFTREEYVEAIDRYIEAAKKRDRRHGLLFVVFLGYYIVLGFTGTSKCGRYVKVLGSTGV